METAFYKSFTNTLPCRDSFLMNSRLKYTEISNIFDYNYQTLIINYQLSIVRRRLMNPVLFEGAAGYPGLMGLWIYLACAAFMCVLSAVIAVKMKRTKHCGR